MFCYNSCIVSMIFNCYCYFINQFIDFIIRLVNTFEKKQQTKKRPNNKVMTKHQQRVGTTIIKSGSKSPAPILSYNMGNSIKHDLNHILLNKTLTLRFISYTTTKTIIFKDHTSFTKSINTKFSFSPRWRGSELMIKQY